MVETILEHKTRIQSDYRRWKSNWKCKTSLNMYFSCAYLTHGDVMHECIALNHHLSKYSWVESHIAFHMLYSVPPVVDVTFYITYNISVYEAF